VFFRWGNSCLEADNALRNEMGPCGVVRDGR